MAFRGCRVIGESIANHEECVRPVLVSVVDGGAVVKHTIARELAVHMVSTPKLKIAPPASWLKLSRRHCASPWRPAVIGIAAGNSQIAENAER
jgi:hypothetical protein